MEVLRFGGKQIMFSFDQKIFLKKYQHKKCFQMIFSLLSENVDDFVAR